MKKNYTKVAMFIESVLNDSKENQEIRINEFLNIKEEKSSIIFKQIKEI